jgi:HSP20 family protein
MRKRLLTFKKRRQQSAEPETMLERLLSQDDMANHLAHNPVPSPHETDDAWLDRDFEGELAVDVFQNDDTIIVQSAIAGVAPENLEIFVDNDMLTIRGKRERSHTTQEKDYFFQECYWGGFSRSIILPTEVKGDAIEAELENGILTVSLPKMKRSKKVRINVVE